MSKIKRIINEEVLRLSQGQISEELGSDNNLYGYHVTSRTKLDSIKNGFNAGHRQMQGKGFYAFYDYSHAQRYAMKGEVSDPVLVKFLIDCKRCLLYLNIDIAKAVLGQGYHLTQQVDDYFKYYGDTTSGLDFILKQANMVYRRNFTMDDLIEKLDYIENNNSEGNQRTFVFEMISSEVNNTLNICWNGNYGLEYRINRTSLAIPLGYMELNDANSYYPFNSEGLVPDSPEFKPLADYIKSRGINSQIISKQDLYKIKYHANEMQNNVRNNRDFDYYQNIIDLVDKIV